MASSTSSSPPPVESSTTRPIACNPCRQRRSQCSKHRPKCERCRELSLDCVYEDSRKITINESYLRELQLKAKAYDDTITESQAPGSQAVPIRNRANGGADNEKEIAEGNALFEDFGRMSVGESGARSPTSLKTPFRGPAHSDMFLRSMGKLPGLMYPDDMSLDLNPRFYEPTLLAPRRLAVRNHVRLPPIDTARRYFAEQYKYIGTIFSFTDPTSFERSLLEAYQSPVPDLADQEACLKYAKILVILAFGQLYSVNQWIDFRGPPGFEYFSHALQLLPDVHEEGSILAVETLGLIGYFMQNMNRRDAAFLYIGMALRMAISLGLHQEVADSSPSSSDGEQPDGASSVGISEEEREHRRRVWWSIYSMDRILCVKSGNPITIQDEDVGVFPATKLPGEPDYCPAVVLRHYTELSRILGDVNKHVYRRGGRIKSGARLMASVKDIMLALARWYRELPDLLRFDPARLAISRESVSTLVHYYQCVNMTARPLLFHVVQKRLEGGAAEKERDWTEGLSQTTVNVIATCVSAAQESIKIMSVAAQRDMVATYGYMDSEHIVSAAIVLVMVCIAFPPNQQNTDAMNAGLSLLRGMAERGNSYIDARYRLLDHLRSMIVPPVPDLTVATGGNDSSEHISAAHQSRHSSLSSAPISSPPMNAAYLANGLDASQSLLHQPYHTLAPSSIVSNTGLHQRPLGFGHIPVATGGAYTRASTTQGGFGLDFAGSNSHALGNTGGAGAGNNGLSQGPAPGDWAAGVPSSDDFSNIYPAAGIGGSGGAASFVHGLNLGNVEEMFFDVNMGGSNNNNNSNDRLDNSGGTPASGSVSTEVGGNNDFGLWEAGFADPAAYDITQLTHAAHHCAFMGGMNMDP